MSKTISIISFDPASFRNLGCAVGVVTLGNPIKLEIAANTFVMDGSSQEPWTCLWPMFNVVDQLLESHKTDKVVLEKTSSFAGGFITGQVSNCIGSILACCGKHDVDIEFVYPTHVKKVVCGKGKATKKEMRTSVVSSLKALGVTNVKFDSEHAYDAVANILTFMHESEEINYTIGQ